MSPRPRPLPARDRDWTDRAECAGDPHHVWITAPHLTVAEDRDYAATICARCPVRDACRLWHEQEATFEGFAAGRSWVVRSPYGQTFTGRGAATVLTIDGTTKAICITCGKARQVRTNRPIEEQCRACRRGEMGTCAVCGKAFSALGLSCHMSRAHRRQIHGEAS